MPKYIKLFIFIIFSILYFSNHGLSAHDRKSITAGIPRDFPPTYFFNEEAKKPDGFAVEVLNNVAAIEGWKVNYVYGKTWDDIEKMLEDGIIDVIPNLGINKARLNKFDFTVPVEIYKIDIFIRSNNDTMTEIRPGNKIGTIVNSVAFEKLKMHKDVIVYPYDSFPAGLFSLLTGKIDAFIGPQDAILKLAREAGFDDRIKILGKSFSEAKRGIAVKKGNDHLLKILDKATEVYLASENFQETYTKWFGRPKPFWTPVKVSLIAGLIFLFAVSFMGIWRYFSIINLNKKLKENIIERTTAEKKIKQQFDEIQSQYEELNVINEQFEITHNELTKANRLINEEKEKLVTTMKSITDAVITTDNSGIIDLFNDSAEKITGYSSDEIKNSQTVKILNLVFDKTGEPLPDPVMNALNSKKISVYQRDVSLLDKTGIRKMISLLCAPIVNSENFILGAVIVIRDITESLKIEKELQRVNKIESLGVFAGGIAHDFNNLLTMIIGNLSLVMLNCNDKDFNYNILKDMENATIRAKKLTNQLLTFSKGGEPVKSVKAIGKVLFETAEFVSSGSKTKVTYDIPDDLLFTDIDEGQISQAVHNIILNAIQAKPESGEIEISARNISLDNNSEIPLGPGRYVKMNIRDNGPGISSEIVAKIFDPYFTTKETGNGLGLAVSFSIISKHNGYITLNPEMQNGAEFIIYLPATLEKPDAEVVKSPSKILKTGKILIMDDEEEILKITKKMLSLMGMDVVCVKDGTDVLDLYESGSRFDAVIMDLTIPGGMGGKETLDRLVKIDPEVSVIVSSGYSNDPIMSDYKNIGFKGVLVKPYRIEEFIDVLNSVIEDKKI